jgi:tetratricopeptide (TPR) repeat protein
MALTQKRAVLAAGVGLAAALMMSGLCGIAAGQTAFASAGEPQAAPERAAQSNQEFRATVTSRADAYFNYTMGHIAEQQYEQTSRSEYATQAIEYYKKAYALDPKSPVIGERLAEMYWKAQRIHEAEAEAKAILQRDPGDVQTRRLLGHIYLRSLGEANGNGQSEAVTRAVEQFKEVVKLDPADTESALWLARLYRLQNRHEQAEAVLRGILKNEPDNEAGVEQLTQLLLDQGKSADAVALLESVTEKSSSPTLLDLLGDAYTQTKDLDKAEAAYRKAAEIDPSELSHQRGLGQTLLTEEKYAEALKVYQRLADLMPDDSDVYLRIAQIYRELHQLDKAEETLTKARQFAPGSLDVMYNEAMLYQAQGRNDDAIRVLSEAVTAVKNQSEVLPTRRRTLAVLYQQLGQLYRATENYQAAIYTYDELGRLGEEEGHRARLLLMETYRTAKDLPRALQTGKEALAKYATDGAIKTSYALLLGEAGKTDDALALLKPQLKGTDADREVYLNIAQVYERGRRYKEAEQSARTAEALPGLPRENEMTWFLLGAIYERQKFFDRAEVEFKKVLAVDPQNAAALNYYGYMLGDLGIRLDEAETMVKKALADDEYNGAYLDSLGWIYYKQGKFSEAEAALRKAVARESHDPTIHSHLGDVYAKTGRTDLAVAQWEKSLEEWKRVLPADVETEKIAEVEKKFNQSKHRVAQKSVPNAAQPK